MTYTELLSDLLRNALVAICPMKPLEPPYPKYFDVNATCDYHGGAIGHSTEKFLSFKHKVQALIDSGWLKFQENKSNIKANPLSGHDNASINAIDLEGHKLVKNVREIKSSRRFIFEALLTVGLLEGEYNLRDACGFHPSAKHSIETCNKFENFLQNLIKFDRQELRASMLWGQRGQEEAGRRKEGARPNSHRRMRTKEREDLHQ